MNECRKCGCKNEDLLNLEGAVHHPIVGGGRVECLSKTACRRRQRKRNARERGKKAARTEDKR